MGVILFVISTWIEFWLNWTDVWFFLKERESFSNCPSYFQRLKKVFGVVVRNIYRNRVFSIRFKIFSLSYHEIWEAKKDWFCKVMKFIKNIYIYTCFIHTHRKIFSSYYLPLSSLEIFIHNLHNLNRFF